MRTRTRSSVGLGTPLDPRVCARSKRLETFCLLFLSRMDIYALAFWVPALIRSTGISDPLEIGSLTAISNLVAVVAIVFRVRPLTEAENGEAIS
jgi:hypothetical protein